MEITRVSVKGRSIRTAQEGQPKLRKTVYPTTTEMKLIKRATKKAGVSDSGFIIEAAVAAATKSLAKDAKK